MGIDASKSVSRFRSLLKAKREQFRRLVCEGLERRELMAVFAPGTTEEYRDAWISAHPGLKGEFGNSFKGAHAFNLLGSRWTNPTGGTSPNMGDPARVSWSIVPDGTRVGSGPTDLQASNLIAFMDGIYGTAPGPVGNRPWFKLVERAYDNWSKVTGINFVYEPNDDGVGQTNSAASRGVTGVRGDIRIGGRVIDGNSGTLAYNFEPFTGGNFGFDGDMVIDTTDNFYSNNSNGPNGENRGLINVLMHEAGHGIGLGHSIPINNTKLMEPNVTFAFLGAQHDDLLGAQTLYGDDFESNDSFANSTDLGARSNGIIQLSNISTDRNADVDVFRFSISNPGLISVSVTPEGQQYTIGNQGGSTAPVNTSLNKDLSFQVETASGIVLATVNAGGVGLAETLQDLALPNAGTYAIRVIGAGAETQMYSLRITLSGIAPPTGPANDTFRLLSVAPNSSEIFSNTRPNVLQESPRELVFRFDADLDRATLRQGIRIRPAGSDKQFTSNDTPLTPAYLDFGSSNRIVIARFAEALPDDLYQVEVFGADIPTEGVRAIRNLTGSQMKPRLPGSDRDIYEFNLELGPRVVAVVPQPVSRDSNGGIVQARNQIEVYFDNADRLHATNVRTGDLVPNPTVVNPVFYQLHADRGTISNIDDAVFTPSLVIYDSARNMVVLEFASNIDQIAPNDTSFRLRIGTNEAKPSAPTPIAPGSDPSSTYAGAFDFGTFNALTSLEIQGQSIVNTTAFPLDFPGAPDTPGSREVDDDPLLGESHYGSDAPDTGIGLGVQQYNFNKVGQIGVDASGQPVFNSITPAQEQRAREIFEFYGSMLGIHFVETESLGWTIATASIDGPNGTLGQAGGGQARMDAGESWWDGLGASDDPAKVSWFAVAMHEIGHLLGLGHSSELPPGSNMGGSYSFATLGGEPAWLTNRPVEPIFPGSASVSNLKYLHRPDSRDIDMYRFTVAARGEFAAEIVAERQANSSNLDAVLTLYRQNANGTREVIAVNDDYFSEDSLLRLALEPGVYFLGVSASGNRDFNPEITDSGLNGTSEGAYNLRTTFRPSESVSIVDVDGTKLDGDSDGVQGGVYNFWFKAAAPNGEQVTQRRTLFVDKQTGSVNGIGTRANPYSRIQDAFRDAVPGDIVRIIPNAGADGNVLSQQDNLAYEVGSGGLGDQALTDGRTMDVPRGVTVMVDAGVLFKMGKSAIGVGSTTPSLDKSNAALQVLGTPERSVVFTAYTDESQGVDTNPLPTTVQSGDWGGLMFRNALDRAEGRFDAELRGQFLNYVSHADMRFGGGQVSIDGNNTIVTPLHMVSARPTLTNNLITRSASAGISADPNSFEESTFTTNRFQSDGAFTPDYDRVGPDIHGNRLLNNSINGLFVRIETLPGESTTSQTVSARWDDIDIVHFVADTLTINGTPGGSLLETTPPALSVVSIASGGNVIGGTLQPGTSYSYRMTFVDANGNEGIASSPTIPFVVPAGANAIALSGLPSARTGFVARKIYRSSDGGVTFRLVAELDRSSTSYVDSAAQRPTLLNTAAQIQRAKIDASLTIDPGMIIKSQNARLVTGVSAQLIAEGTENLPIVFTSRQDDRYGAGGTFDTNNDLSGTVPLPGDWGGLYFGHMGSGSLDHAVITFGGGTVAVGGNTAGFNAVEIHQSEVRISNSTIERNAPGTGGSSSVVRGGAGFNEPAAIFVRGSQPIIIDNIIRNNSAPAISIDAQSMSGASVRDTGRFTDLADRAESITENKGPLFRGNSLGNNNVNGLIVRGGTLTTESVWDDTDIVHVVPHEIVVPDLYVFGGLRLQSSPNESLVVKFGPNAGLTSNGRPLDIDDRIGGMLQVIGTPGFPVILTSLGDDSAGAGFDPEGRAQTDTNNNGTGTAAQPGDWRSLRIAEFSNDRNVLTTVELEPAQSTSAGLNGTPSTAQSLGLLASRETASDDSLRLGFTISGTINNIDDIDVYSFRGTAGTSVWLDVDRTNISLDAVIELIDANGNIIAQSDNSFDESRGVLPIFSNPGAIDGRFVNPMQTSSYSPRNGGSGPATLNNTFADFYSTNPLDPGMRIVLPGVINSVSTYFVRVRSSNIDSRNPLVNRADLQDPAKISNGKTEGQYQLQIRIQELDEFGGSSISLADVRFAQNGIEVLGMPGHSPLVGEAVELGTANNTIATALDLGNLLNTDRAALSVAGDLNSLADVDFYRFQINQVSLQSSGLVQHLSTVIDVDYADGLSRANTSLWLFYDDQNGLGGGTNTGIRLVAFGTDSNIADDIGAPLKGTNLDDLSRGSAGVLDAFLGNIELPSGTYYLAITSNEIVSSYLAQFYQADAGGNPLTRVEPVNSVRRVIESRFGGNTPTTSVGPLQTGFNGGTGNSVPYTLNDVVLFVSQTAPGADNSELITINPLTGRQTSLVSRFPFVADIATRGDGTLHASRSPQTGIINDANSGGISTIDTAGNGATAQTSATSGIQTFELDTSVAPPAVAQALTPGAGNTRAGRGMEFLGLTYPQLGNATQALYASGSRVGATTFTTFAGQRDARNYIYRLDPTSLQAISAPFNDRTDNARLNGAGTQTVERGYVDTSRDAGLRNATSQTIVMADASSPTTPALLSGDKVVIQTPTGQSTFEWVASTLSATLVADTLPQASLVNGNPAPTNFYQDKMSFQLSVGATTRTFEIDTGRVITNNYTPLTAPATWDTSTFTITPLAGDGPARTFEFDATTAITAGNVAVVYDAANSTQFQVSQAIVNAINNQPWNVRAAILPGTNRISIINDTRVVVPAAPASPLTVTQLINGFPALSGGQTYDGATFTITDISGDVRTFEFDSNNSSTGGNVVITFTPTSTAQFLTQAIDAAINFPTGVTPPPANWEARSIFTIGSNTLRILGDSRITFSANTATIINPLSTPTEYGVTGTNIPVLVEEYFTNIDDIRFLPTPSTPGAMDEIVAAINAAGMGITASSNGTRLILTGATGANVNNISTMAFNAPTFTGTPIFFNFTDTSAVLNASLLNAIRTVEPDAIPVAGNRIWLPARSSFVQLPTNDRGDVPSRNAQLSVPQYGTVTGLAFAGAAMFGVSDQGDLYRVGGAAFNVNSSANNGDFIETIYNTTTGQRVQFASLVAGPRNAESALAFSTLGNGLGQILFGIDTTGVLYAFDTLGRPAHVFPDGRWFIQTQASNVSGLAFSNLDVNLWHESANRGAAADVGHGVNVSFDGSRRTQTNGGNSLYFGFDNPNDTLRQSGDFSGINNPIGASPGYDAARENTYDFPGGAKGSVISNTLDLSAYGPADKPTLYFNYFLQTENANANNPGDNNFMKDALRVFVSDQTGGWQLLATNNSDYDALRTVGQRDELDYPFEIDPFNALNRQVSELFDIGDVSNGLTAPNSWRQARLDLSRFAGQKDVRIRFDFSTSGSTVGAGGIELTTVAASEIPIPVAQRQFVINDPTRGNITFEFDFGLLLQIPSGARLSIGDQFEVDGVTYTFAIDNVGNNILFNANDSAEAIAARIVPKLIGQGLNAVVDPVTPSRISVINAVNTTPFVSPTLPPGFIADVPGTGFNQRVLIHSAMTAVEVRDAVRVAFARAFNIVGQETNLDAIRFNDRTIYLWNKTVINRGPLLFAGTALQGDEFGERNSGVTNTVGSGAQRGQNNRFEGVYIDDIIVGFAEHGEMVTYQNNGTASVTTFIDNPRHEPSPNTFYQEVETGTYQIEIRRGFTYGVGGTTFPSLGLFSTFDTNDRGTQQISLVAPRGSQLFDGQTFQLSDGVDTVTYEYDDTSITSGPRQGVSQGNVRVPFLSSHSEVTVAQSIRDAINSIQSRAILDVVAGISDGTVVGTTNTGKLSGSRIVHIHGRVAASNSGSSGFSGTRFTTASGANSNGFILYGIDTFRINEAGDANRNRDQGQILVHSNIIRDSAGFGIVVDAGARTNNTLIPLAGVLPHPGSVRNLLQFNQEDLVPGTVIANNLIYAAAVGGILFSGDQRSATTIEAPVSFGRIVNNTIVGVNSTGTGIRVTENASPTLLNNIVSSLATGITVDGSSTTTVVGFTTYKGNANNIGGALVSLGDRPQVLAANEPLFVSETLRNFYLAAGSRAIDSSMDSLNDRQSMTTVREPLGIAPSPILSPDFDIAGQLRKDDPNVSNPDGTGANPFKDRGAFERVDLSGLDAIIQQPLDNDPDIVDDDRSNTNIRLTSGNLEFFSLLLFESEGTGPDPRTVTEETVLVTENGRLLRPGVDYVFGYSPSSRQIRLTPLAGFWRRDSVYELTLVNQASFRINTPRGSAINDGQQIRFNVGVTPFILEFDSGNGVTAGAIAVPYAASFTESMIAGALMKVLTSNNLVGVGVNAYAISNSSLKITGVTNLALSPVSSAFSTLSVPPIADLAGNRLKPNRINTLTQFTIAMPEATIDFGDAMQRPAGGSSSTTVVSNGARHAMFPVDEPLLVLGHYADADLDGVPSIGADADDNDSLIDLGNVPSFGLGNNGPVRLTTLASTADLQNKSITISDNFFNVVSFQFKHDNSPVTIANAIPVSVAVNATADQVATALRNAIHNEAILKGLLRGISAQVAGNLISINASSSHLFDLSGSVHNTVPFIQRQATGTQSIQVKLPANDLSLVNGLRRFTIDDGSGNTVVFQIVDRSAPVPSVVSGNNVPVFVNINPIITPAEPADTDATFATKVASAINGAIAARRLNLPQVTVSGNEVRLLSEDEDGVTFNGFFNSVLNSGTPAVGSRPATPAAPVATTIFASNPGYIDVWVDWNQDNDFNDAGEQLLDTQPVVGGANLFNFITPSSAAIGYTTARFRLSATGGTLTTGLAVGGEVEDHLIEVVTGSPPVAANDSYTVNENGLISSTLSVATPGILANDFDADDQTSIRVYDENRTSTADVSMQPLVAPRFGVLALKPDGSFTYTPNPHFNGVDTFVYRTTDSRMVSANAATVTLTVHKVNDAPKAFDDIRTIDEDTIIEWSWSDLTANDFAGITTLPQRSGDAVGLEILGYDANGAILAGATDRGFGSERDQNLNIVNVRLLGTARLNPSEAGGLENVTIVNPTDTNRANRKVRYAPGTNYNNLIAGPVVIEITIEDEEVNLNGAPAGNNIPRQTKSLLTVNINAMNDRPTVVVNNGNLEVNYVEDVNPAKSIPVSVWAGPLANPPANPTVGGADDENGFVSGLTGQGTSFNTTAPDVTRVRALDPLLFSVQPTITPATGTAISRTLSFTLAPDVNSLVSGPILIEIFGMDDGTVAGPGSLGGVHHNESLIQRLTLNVAPVNDAPFATADTVRIDEDTSIVISAASILSNDYAGHNPTLTNPRIDNEERDNPATPPEDRDEDQRIRIVEVQLINAAGAVRALKPGESLTWPASDTAATGLSEIRFTPGRNYNDLIDGPVFVLVTIEDTGVTGSTPALDAKRATSTLTININAMNDRPTVTLDPTSTLSNLVPTANGAQFNISENPGAQTIPVSVTAGPVGIVGAAVGVSGGADDENGRVTFPATLPGQNVSFNTLAPDVTRVRALDPLLFSVQPTITAATGTDVARTLSFTLAPNVNSLVSGPIFIEIFGMDDGTVAGPGGLGGVHFNESVRQTLTLNVAPVNDAPFATNDVDTIDEDTAKKWPTSFLLSNDYAGHNPNRVPPKLDDEDVQTIVVRSVQLINPDGSLRAAYPGELLELTTGLNPEVQYTPGTHYNNLVNGEVLVRVEIIDNGVSGPLPNPTPDPKTAFSTFTININPINDRPIVTVDPNRTKIDPTLASSGVLRLNVLEDPGQQVIPITAIAGPAGNAGQPLGRSEGADDELGRSPRVGQQSIAFTNLTVRALRPALFAVQPQIVAASGTSIDRNLTFTLAPDVNFVSAGIIEIEIFGTDDGLTGNGTAGGVHQAESLRQTLSIRVSEINDPPIFDLASTTITIDEDAPRQVLPAFYFNEFAGPLTAIDEIPPAPTAQTVVRSVSVPPQAVDLYAVLPTLDPLTGEVQFQYKQDVNINFATLRGVPGLFNLIFTATDDGRENGVPVPRSTSKTVAVTVNAINDSPFFTLSRSRVDVIEDAGPVTVAGFATNVRQAFNLLNGQMTAADEVNQGLTFNMNFSNPSLFTTPPAIDDLGALTFRTAPHQNGTSVITARLVDTGASSPFPNNNLGPVLTFTISVQAINDAPEFTIPPSLTVNEGAGVVSIPGFATDIRPGPASASDENRQSLTFNLDSFDPNLFEVAPSLQPDGTLSFRTKLTVNSLTPGINRVVTFQLQDGGLAGPSPNTNLSIKQSFTLNIDPVNNPPIPDIHTVTDVLEDSRITVLASDVLKFDVPGPIDEVIAGQTVRMTQIAPTSEFGGTVIANMLNGVVESFDYIPPPNLAGIDTIRYVVTDNGLPERSATGTIVIRPSGVNDPPQFTPGQDISLLEDAAPYSATWATNILAGPPDESSQNVSFIVAPSIPGDRKYFAVDPAISSSGILSFTLAKDVNGLVVLDVFARDDGGSNTSIGDLNVSPTHRLTISIGSVNDPAGFVLAGPVVVDEDSGPFSAPFMSKIVPAEGMNSNPQTGTDESTQTLTIRVTNNNNRLFAVQPTIDESGRLTFTPADNAFGNVEVYVEVVDNGPSSPPNVNTSPRQTFSITLSSKNDNPIANADQYSTTEDALLTIAASGLLTNDVDPDLPNDVLSVLVPAGTVTSTLGARVVLNANGSFTYDPRSTVRLQELRAGETIVDSFTYTIGDGFNGTSNIASVAITVEGVNDAPVAVNDTFQVAVGTTTLLDVLQNDLDVDSAFNVTSIEIGQLPANGTAIPLSTGRIEFRSAPGFVGVNTFTYRVRDSLGALSNEATVRVNTSIPPIAGNDLVSTIRNRPVDIDVLRNDSDPDSNGGLDPTSVTIVSPPNSGSAVRLNDGKIRYTPIPGFVGVASLQYTVADISGQVSNVATVTIQVLTSLYQNPNNRLDVDDDGFVSAIDVLVLVNDINANGQRVLPEGLVPPPYLDVNGDGSVSSLDVLAVVNFINTNGNGGAGEGEGESVPDLDWRPINVEIMSTEDFTQVYKSAALRESMMEFDLSLAKTIREEFGYGPLLANEDGDEPESLADYLAAWDDIEGDDDDLDSVFANSDWL